RQQPANCWRRMELRSFPFARWRWRDDFPLRLTNPGQNTKPRSEAGSSLRFVVKCLAVCLADHLPPVMSDKPEPRLDVKLPVRVFGMGANGRPFLQSVQARNISHHGAKLFGLETPLKPGDIIGVQVGEKKARCKVIWVVDPG